VEGGADQRKQPGKSKAHDRSERWPARQKTKCRRRERTRSGLTQREADSSGDGAVEVKVQAGTLQGRDQSGK